MNLLNEIKTIEQLNQQIEEAMNKKLILLFFTSEKGPSKLVEPKVQDMDNEYPSLIVLRIYAEDCDDIFQEYEVDGMPTFVLIDNELEVERVVGSDIQKVRALVKEKIARFD